MKKINVYRCCAYLFLILGIALTVFLLFKYFLPVAFPFLLAAALGGSVLPLAKRVTSFTKIPLWFTGSVLLTLLFVSLGLLAVFVADRILIELTRLSSSLAEEGGGELGQLISSTVDYVSNLTSRLPIIRDIRKAGGLEEVWDKIDAAAASSITNAISSFGRDFGEKITGFIATLPSMLVGVAVVLIASYYFSTGNAAKCVRSLIPQRLHESASRLKQRVLSAVFGWARAYLLLTSLTFCILFTGFLILKVKYAFLLALLVALVDVLPVLGTGTVLIPWAIFSVVSGNAKLGAGLLILYGAATLFHEIAEPKIVGKTLGLPPLLTLVTMYAGLRFFGVFGMLSFPAIVMMAKSVLSGANDMKKKAEEVN